MIIKIPFCVCAFKITPHNFNTCFWRNDKNNMSCVMCFLTDGKIKAQISCAVVTAELISAFVFTA